MRQTIAEVVPPAHRNNYNGRKMSQHTQDLYRQRIRDYNSGREITESDRRAWNKVPKEADLEDYKDWVKLWIKKIEAADNIGDIKEISRGTKVLFGTTRNSNFAQPSVNKDGDIITSAEELGGLWHQFLQKKFSATELEKAREEYPDLSKHGLDETHELSQQEYLAAVKRMKNGKVTGPDGIPAEVWKHSPSQLAKEELYFFLQAL